MFWMWNLSNNEQQGNTHTHTHWTHWTHWVGDWLPPCEALNTERRSGFTFNSQDVDYVSCIRINTRELWPEVTEGIIASHPEYDWNCDMTSEVLMTTSGMKEAKSWVTFRRWISAGCRWTSGRWSVLTATRTETHTETRRNRREKTSPHSSSPWSTDHLDILCERTRLLCGMFVISAAQRLLGECSGLI